ncbi:LOW QUALITY PROTEIN: hypothetical protein V2J09_013159 [Rumex salicifolius]
MRVILKPSDKIRSSDQYDSYSRTSTNSRFLFCTRVVQHMMLGPCGSLNLNCGCMKEKKGQKVCRFEYPKIFSPMRRTGTQSISVTKMGITLVFERWVISYNSFLFVEFHCHINIEIFSIGKAVKYIYKYEYKGHDHICFDIEKRHMSIEDEPSCFQSARWVFPPEAGYKIYRFDLYDMQHPVIPLQVYLPDMNIVPFGRNHNMETLINSEHARHAMLIAYFCNNPKLKFEVTGV